jgi:hypothetical protein
MSIEITKIFRPHKGKGTSLAMAQIHANHYDSSLSHVNEMAKTLKEDFPNIKDEDIKVHKYGGQRIKGITLVEIQLGEATEVPYGYDEVSEIEYIL